jgi:hypothetical protein
MGKAKRAGRTCGVTIGGVWRTCGAGDVRVSGGKVGEEICWICCEEDAIDIDGVGIV